MTTPLKIRRLLPLLAVGAVLAFTASAEAQSSSLQVRFGSRPHWNTVRGTSVREIRQDQRPDYDMFRYGGNYYAYNNNQWYTSRSDHGQFNEIDQQRVPSQLSRVPRDHWRNYPSGWTDQNAQQSYGRRRYGNRYAQPGNAQGHR